MKRLISLIIPIILTLNINAVEKSFSVCLKDNLNKTKTTITTIKSLECKNTNLKEYPDLSKFSSLTRVNFNNNNISSFKYLTSNTKIKHLSLAGNTMYYLPDDLKKLKNLESLILNSTHLIELSNLDSLSKLTSLEVMNNQLFEIPKNNIKSIKTDYNYLTSNYPKQSTLHLKVDNIDVSKEDVMFTFKERMQRIIVNSNNIPLNGVNEYTLSNVKDSDNKTVNLNDYLNINTNDTYKDGELEGYVALKLKQVALDTKIKIKLSIKGNTITISDPMPTPIPDPDKPREDKEKKKTVLKQESIFYNAPLKELSEDSAIEFFKLNNVYILNIVLLLLVFIPLVLLLLFLRKIKQVKLSIDEIL